MGELKVELSGEFIGLIIVSYVVVVLLNIILFFKIWGMTNSVSEIKELIKEWIDLEHPLIENDERERKKNKE